MIKIRRALLSVSDKTGLAEFGSSLSRLGVELISTGGTHKTLQDAGVNVAYVSEVTGFPEILEGRVKSLHPKIHAGILARRDKEEHLKQLDELGIGTIDLVVVNLYPFEATVAKPDVTMEEAIENIDIGGPTLIRAAAKNHAGVAVVVDPSDYAKIIQLLKTEGGLTDEFCRDLALKAFRHTARYDALIARFLGQDAAFPETLTLPWDKVADLRYGENPHQKAAFYQEPGHGPYTLAAAKQLHGKELSFNNINDTNGALELLKEFTNPTVVASKHTNPCGVASADDLATAFRLAYEGDPVSIFGGIIAVNRVVDAETAKQMSEIFLEVVVAPGFTAEALEILTVKPNIRLLQIEGLDEACGAKQKPWWDYKRVAGGLLVQAVDLGDLDPDKLQVVTKVTPTPQQLESMLFGWKVVKHVKSNAIVLASGTRTVGVGAGQMNRITAAELAIAGATDKAQGGVIASDAFFPFDDVVKAAAKAGVKAIIQPGGSVRDQDSIDAANEHGIAMVFTGVRHFKH
ncbi:MAG: bifunctional phosphoribosylaminoimidazolecarboxamide formyltransferase/IMP cyclohydrolase [Limnochordia bacterium]|jgi:phosphoribosylaminoimidazolecarboxamide formyltransferase/IMP cyclohydrolase|nr:bifunctional phosphoribosylaminoimidazolecarboxamide formyltransferase/IMP cyclohydrolase [Limnochordia bacterium]